MGNKQKTPLNHTVVLITGASSGLGRQLAIQFAKSQLSLIITGRNKKRLHETVKMCESYGKAEVQPVQVDLDTDSNCKDLIDEVIKKYGRIDILVLNAGVNAHFTFGELKETEIYEKVMRTNFFANVFLAKHALPHLRHSKGHIVVISSISGKFGLPDRSAYCASKFALTGFFESLRTQEDNISISIVYPTSLDTPMRNNDLMGAKTASNHSQNKQQSASKTAELIVSGLSSGQNDIYIPVKLWVGTWMQPLFPTWMRNKVKAAAKL